MSPDHIKPLNAEFSFIDYKRKKSRFEGEEGPVSYCWSKREGPMWQRMWADSSSWQQPWLSASKGTGASVLQLIQEMYAAYNQGAWERIPGPRGLSPWLTPGFQSREILSRIQLLHAQTSVLQHWVLIYGCCFKFGVLWYFADKLQLISTFVQELLLMSNIPRLPVRTKSFTSC